jgi:hypothetical protein
MNTRQFPSYSFSPPGEKVAEGRMRGEPEQHTPDGALLLRDPAGNIYRIPAAELERRRLAAPKQPEAVLHEHPTGKYDFQGSAEVDCATLIPICHAACCRLRLGLSAEDVAEGIVRWDPDAPYLNLQRPDGVCVHLNSETLGCSVYSHRPIPCRGYDCRTDPRIWLDFDNRVVNPRIHQPGPLNDSDTLPVLAVRVRIES